MRLIKVRPGDPVSRIAPFFSMVTKVLAAAKNEMEKDFHKLLNNGVYGKTCVNQSKLRDIHLVNMLCRKANASPATERAI